MISVQVVLASKIHLSLFHFVFACHIYAVCLFVCSVLRSTSADFWTLWRRHLVNISWKTTENRSSDQFYKPRSFGLVDRHVRSFRSRNVQSSQHAVNFFSARARQEWCSQLIFCGAQSRCWQWPHFLFCMYNIFIAFSLNVSKHKNAS